MEKCSILATGETLDLFDPTSKDFRIGVNKILLRHPVDHLLCIDVPASFRKEVVQSMQMGDYSAFVTNRFGDWRKLIDKKIYEIQTKPISYPVKLDEDYLLNSVSSPFVAVHYAYKIGFKIIDLYGADYNSHRNFTEIKMQQKIISDFMMLQNALLEKGCSIRVTPNGLLSEYLPLIPKHKMYQDSL